MVTVFYFVLLIPLNGVNFKLFGPVQVTTSM